MTVHDFLLRHFPGGVDRVILCAKKSVGFFLFDILIDVCPRTIKQCPSLSFSLFLQVVIGCCLQCVYASPHSHDNCMPYKSGDSAAVSTTCMRTPSVHLVGVGFAIY